MLVCIKLFFRVKQCHGVEGSRCQGVGINNVLVCIKLFSEKTFQENIDRVGDNDPRGHCNKDTEGIVTLNTYSRGHQVFVSGTNSNITNY